MTYFCLAKKKLQCFVALCVERELAEGRRNRRAWRENSLKREGIVVHGEGVVVRQRERDSLYFVRGRDGQNQLNINTWMYLVLDNERKKK